MRSTVIFATGYFFEFLPQIIFSPVNVADFRGGGLGVSAGKLDKKSYDVSLFCVQETIRFQTNNNIEYTVKPRFTAQFGRTEKGAVNRGER